jgi:hypothetical protein
MHFILAEASNPDPLKKWGAIALGVGTIIWVVFIRPMRKEKKDPLSSGPRTSSLSQQRAVEREMSNLLVELSEMTRQMTAQIDTRAAKLEVLIKEADERLAALKAATGAALASPVGSTRAELMEPGYPPSRARDLPASPAVDPQHMEVYGLADEGHPTHEIARRLSRPSGEIELILALRAPR